MEPKTNENLEDVMEDLEYKVNPKSIEEAVSKLTIAVQTNDPSIMAVPEHHLREEKLKK
jgi:hypothetical protein